MDFVSIAADDTWARLPGPIWIGSEPIEEVVLYANYDATSAPDDHTKMVQAVTPKVDVAAATAPAPDYLGDSVIWPITSWTKGYIAPWVAAALGFALIAPAVMPDALLGGAAVTGYALGGVTNYFVEKAATEAEQRRLETSVIKPPTVEEPLKLVPSAV